MALLDTLIPCKKEENVEPSAVDSVEVAASSSIAKGASVGLFAQGIMALGNIISLAL